MEHTASQRKLYSIRTLNPHALIQGVLVKKRKKLGSLWHGRFAYAGRPYLYKTMKVVQRVRMNSFVNLVITVGMFVHLPKWSENRSLKRGNGLLE